MEESRVLGWIKPHVDIGGLSYDMGFNTLGRACSKAGFLGNYRDEKIPPWQMA